MYYLSDVSATWKKKVGYSTTITNWPTGTGAAKNAGVAAAVQATPGAIGYVSAAYISKDSLSSASVENSSGKFIKVSINSIAVAARQVKKVPANNEISLVDPPKSSTYFAAWPIATFTYVFLHKSGDVNTAATNTTKAFISWAVKKGQGMIRSLVFAPLPSLVVTADVNTLKKVSFK